MSYKCYVVRILAVAVVSILVDNVRLVTARMWPRHRSLDREKRDINYPYRFTTQMGARAYPTFGGFAQPAYRPFRGFTRASYGVTPNMNRFQGQNQGPLFPNAQWGYTFQPNSYYAPRMMHGGPRDYQTRPRFWGGWDQAQANRPSFPNSTFTNTYTRTPYTYPTMFRRRQTELMFQLADGEPPKPWAEILRGAHKYAATEVLKDRYKASGSDESTETYSSGPKGIWKPRPRNFSSESEDISKLEKRFLRSEYVSKDKGTQDRFNGLADINKNPFHFQHAGGFRDEHGILRFPYRLGEHCRYNDSSPAWFHNAAWREEVMRLLPDDNTTSIKELFDPERPLNDEEARARILTQHPGYVLRRERYYDYISRAELVSWWRNGSLSDNLYKMFFRNTPKYKGYVDLFWNVPVQNTTRRISALEMRLREKLWTRQTTRYTTHTTSATYRTSAIPEWKVSPPVNRSDHRAYAQYILRMNFSDLSWEKIKQDGDHIRFERFRRPTIKVNMTYQFAGYGDSLSMLESNKIPLISVPNNTDELYDFDHFSLKTQDYIEFANRTGNFDPKKISKDKIIKRKRKQMADKLAEKFYKLFGTAIPLQKPRNRTARVPRSRNESAEILRLANLKMISFGLPTFTPPKHRRRTTIVLPPRMFDYNWYA